MNLSVKNRLEPLIITIVNIVARGSHLLFFMFIGNKYGASDTTDIVLYLIAPLTVLTAVTSGAAEAVIMPMFHKSKNADTARHLFIYSIKRNSLFIIPLSIITLIISSIINEYCDFFPCYFYLRRSWQVR